MTKPAKKNEKRKWVEKLLPFVSKSPKMKLKWLEGAFKKKVLTLDEITPYVRLLLSGNSVEEKQQLEEFFQDLDLEMQYSLIEAADIYDTPEIFRLLDHPTVGHARIALIKNVPLYEKKTQMILDKVFYAISNFSKDLLAKTIELLEKEGKASAMLLENYERFKEILNDEEFLLSLYSKARG